MRRAVNLGRLARNRNRICTGRRNTDRLRTARYHPNSERNSGRSSPHHRIERPRAPTERAYARSPGPPARELLPGGRSKSAVPYEHEQAPHRIGGGEMKIGTDMRFGSAKPFRRGLRTVVTGGAGFIGSHLCDQLIQRGDIVICVDNLFTGSMRNIRPLLNHPNFSFYHHDVREPMSISGQVDRIYNLACPASPRHYQRDPIATMKTCVMGATNVLELAALKGSRVLQASTSEVYGDPEIHPQPESYVGHVNPIGPRACYDEGKRAAETLIFDYHRLYGVQIKVARIFNTYGPRM